jgi:hypothetical protein
LKDHFDFLTLKISLWRPKPADIQPGEFVNRVLWEPYDQSLDFMARRTLVHETFHYWQAVGCRFLQQVVDEEWSRFLDFVGDSTRIASQGPLLIKARSVDAELGFSALDLLEGLTRFWEIHGQSPLELLRQEAVENQDSELLASLNPSSPSFRVPWLAIELAMRHGFNCGHYGAPFRWLLAKVGAALGMEREPTVIRMPDGTQIVPGHLTSAGFATCILFPIVSFLALCTDDPVRTFKSTISRMVGQGFLFQFNLNFAPVADHVLGLPLYFDRILEFMLDSGVPILKSAVDPLSNDKPIDLNLPPYSWCVQRLDAFSDVFRLVCDQYDDELATETSSFIAHYGSNGALALMGLREIRQTLVGVLPPPCVTFSNGQTSYPIPTAIAGGQKDSALRIAHLDSVEVEVARFRRAEKAASLGLALDAFEKM